MQIRNPIVPGFAPDPSIVRVGNKFYMVTSSFHVFPGLPIYESTNLQNWELKGHAICRVSQLDLSQAFTKLIPLPDGRPLVITGGLFAPTIRYFDGHFHIACTNAVAGPDGDGFYNFIISCAGDQIYAKDGWSDPKWFDFPGIDPSLFFDPSTNKAYVHGSYRTGPPWAPECSIRQFEIDIKTGKTLTDIRHLWNGASTDAEGPHPYAKDGWYYLITAEGSTFEPHEINIARSRDIWGPYESYQNNPLLTAHNRDTDVRWTGHGDFFTDTKGRWFCVHLGIRYNRNAPGCYPLGRETFLTPMRWDENEWPSISQTQLRFDVGDSKGDKASAVIASSLGKIAESERLYLRSPQMQDYRFEDSRILLKPQISTLSCKSGTSTFVGCRQRALVGQAFTKVIIPNETTPGIQMGLGVFKDCLQHALIVFDPRKSTVRLLQSSLASPNEGALEKVQAALDKETAEVELRIVANAETYTFEYRASDNWQQLGVVNTADLSGYNMTGTIFGILAYRNGGSNDGDSQQTWAEFDTFEVT